MKIVALILLLLISSGSFAQEYIASFPAQNNTTGLKPIHLGSANNSTTESLNSSDYYHITYPIWDQFANYLPLASIHEWFSKYSINPPAAVPNFLRDDWKPSHESMATPTIKQFAKEDRYREGVEPHDDPDRMELNHFLDSDEPPGRPLL